MRLRCLNFDSTKNFNAILNCFFQVRLYLGLAIMCGFVLYDTQLIVEKCRRGDVDYIRYV